MIFVNKVIVERFGLMARFGFMHLVATNLSLWVRTIIWESANEWMHHIYRQQKSSELLLGKGDGVSVSQEGPLALGLRTDQRYRRHEINIETIFRQLN